MKLSEVPSELGIQTVRDGWFENLGLVAHQSAAMLSFLESERYLAELVANPRVSCVVAAPALAEAVPREMGVAVAASPRSAFYHLHNRLAATDFYWKSFASQVAPSARVHPRAYVAERDVRIGERCVIEPNATILERTIIDDDCIVRAGAVIGSEGFHFMPEGDALLPVAHAGGVHLHRRSEVQSCACVDKAIFGAFTEVGEDSRIDNLCQIAHNVKLGKRNRVAAGAMVAGSVETGDDVWIGPTVAISHMLRVAGGATLTMGAVVTRNVAPGQRVTGHFAIEHDKFIAFMRSIR